MTGPKLTFESEAQYGTTMTLEELGAFVQNARQAGIGGLARVKVRVDFRAGIKQVSVKSTDIVKPRRDDTVPDHA